MNTLETFVLNIVKNRVKSPADLARLKRKLAKELKVSLPGNIALLKTYRQMIRSKRIKRASAIEKILCTRPIRSLSGIVNISVLTKPYPCPGQCLYCPQEPGIPKSYLSGEPAVERAKKLKYHPYWQVKKRMEMLEAQGHPTDKIELRIVGGTWSYYPQKYRQWFVKNCFDACNRSRTSPKLERKSDFEKSDFFTAQKKNQTAKHRIIGLSIETRPDFINEREIKLLRQYGATMVELGVQNIDEKILKLNRRGHSVKETIRATQLLKNAGFKILFQMMPNLPGSSPSEDLEMFKRLFSDENFKPDMLKIYPCALVKQSPLYQWWLKGRYKPYSKKQLIGLIKSIKKLVPYYVRIQRISRDIPSHSIIAGPAKISNIRERVLGACKCIRCREVRENFNPKEKPCLSRQNYRASGGKEIFLSFENKKRTKLYSLLRLRIADTAIIRELHTYGQLQPIIRERFSLRRETFSSSPQHRGLGKKLVAEAEKIAKKEFGTKKIAVISGIGARQYWQGLGYKLENTYMVKNLRPGQSS